VQAREDGAVDAAGQVLARIGDILRGGEEVLGGFDGDLPADPVEVGPARTVTAVRSAW
jgi:hypothetical protein